MITVDSRWLFLDAPVSSSSSSSFPSDIIIWGSDTLNDSKRILQIPRYIFKILSCVQTDRWNKNYIFKALSLDV